jgi:hypothetical protein
MYTHQTYNTSTHQPSNLDGERGACIHNEIMSANSLKDLHIKDFAPACLPACQRDFSATRILSQK